MHAKAVVVVGASAGGVEALREFVGALPPDFPAAVLVVLHVPSTGMSVLPQILDRAGPLPVRHAGNGDPLRAGEILVAPPDRHMVVFDHAVTLTNGPRENGHRPAIDVTFRTAARIFGQDVIGVVLSGSLDDGSAGMIAVTLRGGQGVVQSPDEALHPSMPEAARAAAEGVHEAKVGDIPALLLELMGRQQGPESTASALLEKESAMARNDIDAMNDPDRPGHPSGLSCPDCSGSLFEIDEGGLQRYRCRVGHAWSPQSLVAEQAASFESALWIALRALEEKVAFAVEAAARARNRAQLHVAARLDEQVADGRVAAGQLKELIDQLSATDGYDELWSHRHS